MATVQQTEGMRGVFLVAAELSRHGFIVAPTSRSARGADLLVTSHDCQRTFSIDVKKVTGKNFFQLSRHVKSLKSKTFVYVFVHVKKKKEKGKSEPREEISYYPVPSRVVAESVHRPGRYRKGYSIWLSKIEAYKDKWNGLN